MIARSEYPRPQFERKSYECLNGIWEFETDKSNSGVARRVFEKKKLDGVINVPFCPESPLSGVGDKDFLNSVWYKRSFDVKAGGQLVFLHIGACDYNTTVYINGRIAGQHSGGYTPIDLDITEYVNEGTNDVIIHAEDDNRVGKQPSGKQSSRYESYGCYYTRTTGIWQTVWLEYVPKTYIKDIKLYPNPENAEITVKATLIGSADLNVVASYEGKKVGAYSTKSSGGVLTFTNKLSEKHLWEVGVGRLYDLELNYGEDEVKSYFGLRSVKIDGYKFLINNKSVFQRLVLDQGFYPDGICTAPTEEDLVKDIILSLDAGFNGARLHQKVFEPRFLYHCDRLGYIVWGEYASWGIDHTTADALIPFLREWQEAVARDFNHPSIIGWCPFNETWNIKGRVQNDGVIEMIYRSTKAIDPTRPCIDTSGNYHVITDIYDVHEYTQIPKDLKDRMDAFAETGIINEAIQQNPIHKGRQKHDGRALFVSEYGGIKWDVENDSTAWGYGNAPTTEDEYKERYRLLTDALLR